MSDDESDCVYWWEAERWAQRTAPTVTAEQWSLYERDAAILHQDERRTNIEHARALITYRDEVAAGLDPAWQANLMQLCDDRPVAGTSELTRLGLVRWTDDGGGSVYVTDFGRAVARMLGSERRRQ